MNDDDDRIALGAGEWLLLRHFPLRSAGFPLSDLSSALVDDTADLDELCAGSDDAILAWWEGATDRAQPRIVELAQKERLIMALLWQNPYIAENTVPWLARSVADGARGRSGDYRAQERIVLRYLQRYHTKNETIGFFGPIVWAAIDPEGDRALTFTPGDDVARRQRVWFEDGPINDLGSSLAQDPDLAPHLPISIPIGVARFGHTLINTDGSARRLTPWEAKISSLVDGSRTARDLAAAAAVSLDDVEGTVAPLVADGLLSRTFDVPIERGAEQAFVRELGGLPPSAAVERTLGVLADMEAARAEVAAASNSTNLGKALRKVNDIVDAAVPPATPQSRPKNRQRAMLSLSERDMSLVIGPHIVGELSAPLALILASARWLCRRAGEEFDDLAMPTYRELASMFGDGAVPFDVLCQRLVPTIREGDWLHGIVAELQQRWSEVLDVDPGVSRVTRRSADLTDAVVSRFDGPAPGWHAGRHHSPDVMIAASSPAAVEAGDYELVLGELHVAMVTCDQSAYYDLAPDPDLVRRCVDAALLSDQPRFVPLHPRSNEHPFSCYGYPVPEAFSPAYTYLSFGERVGERAAPGPRIAAASLLVRAAPSGPVVDFPDGSCHPLLHVMGEYVTYGVAAKFRLTPPLPHHPRVTIDRLVVARETWRVPVNELEPFAHLPEAEAYLGVCRLAARYGLARHSFWRPARMTKPIYLDLCSPALVGLLLTAARAPANGAGTFTFTEMYPGPGQLWLTDAHSNHYTSEIRFTIADTRPPAPRPKVKPPDARSGR
jgi:hypothetical protein